MGESITTCRCCEQMTLTERDGYEICEACGWEDDGVQNREPEFAGGANQMSLNEARAYWQGTHARVECSNASAEMERIQREAHRLMKAGK